MDPLKMYFLLKIGDIPASYVSLPEGNAGKTQMKLKLCVSTSWFNTDVQRLLNLETVIFWNFPLLALKRCTKIEPWQARLEMGAAAITCRVA